MKENNSPQKYRPPAVRRQNEATSQQSQNMMYANPVVNHAIYEPQHASNNNDPAEAKIAKYIKDIRVLLNNINPSTFKVLSVEMINKCVWQDEETLPTVVELIFKKAIEEPALMKVYSDLCHSVHKAEQNMEKENFKHHFHYTIIRKCQSNFENTALSEYPETVAKLHEQIKEEEDEKKIADLKKELEEMNFKAKRQMLGTIKFISHLFRIGLLNFKIMKNCIFILIRKAEESNKETMIEYAVVMMKCVGPHVGQKTENITKLDGYVSYLDKFKTVSNRVKFMIMDLMELRDRKWVQQQK